MADLSAQDASLERGWEAFNIGAYDTAANVFKALSDPSIPNSVEQRRALYGSATNLALRRPGEDPAAARILYQRIVTLAPDSEEAAWSLLGIARLGEFVEFGEKIDLAALHTAYQKVIDGFPDHPAGEEAYLHQQARVIGTLKPEDSREAVVSLEKFILTHPATPLLSSAYTLLVTAHDILQQPKEAYAARVAALQNTEIDPTNPNSDKAGNYWTLAVAAQYDLGDFAEARKYYQLLLSEYPTDDRRFGARLALREMDEREKVNP